MHTHTCNELRLTLDLLQQAFNYDIKPLGKHPKRNQKKLRMMDMPLTQHAHSYLQPRARLEGRQVGGIVFPSWVVLRPLPGVLLAFHGDSSTRNLQQQTLAHSTQP